MEIENMYFAMLGLVICGPICHIGAYSSSVACIVCIILFVSCVV